MRLEMSPFREITSTQFTSGKPVDCMIRCTEGGLSSVVLRGVLLRVFDGRVDQPGMRGGQDQVTELARESRIGTGLRLLR